MAFGREAQVKTARYLATCYFWNETIGTAASAAPKIECFCPAHPALRLSVDLVIYFTQNDSIVISYSLEISSACQFSSMRS